MIELVQITVVVGTKTCCDKKFGNQKFFSCRFRGTFPEIISFLILALILFSEEYSEPKCIKFFTTPILDLSYGFHFSRDYESSNLAYCFQKNVRSPNVSSFSRSRCYVGLCYICSHVVPLFFLIISFVLLAFMLNPTGFPLFR